jgi:hypothetical protein
VLKSHTHRKPEAQGKIRPKIAHQRLDCPVWFARSDLTGVVAFVGLVGLTLRSGYYRQNALELLRLWNTTLDPRAKAMFIDMAVAWRRVAYHVDSIRHRPNAHLPTLVPDRTRQSA